MLFNGKYYNKPGHLGMTRTELLEKLNGGGGGGGNFVTITDDGENITCDHTYDELYENVSDYNFRVAYPSDTTSIAHAARFNDRNQIIEVFVLSDMLAELKKYTIHSDNSITVQYGSTYIEVTFE